LISATIPGTNASSANVYSDNCIVSATHPYLQVIRRNSDI
jgi:hypothetical protein